MKNRSLLCVAIGLASLLNAAPFASAQTTIFSDDFNRASLGGNYTISQGAGSGTAFIVTNTVLFLTNGATSGWVSVATNLAAGNGFDPTPGTWSFTSTRADGQPSTTFGFQSETVAVPEANTLVLLGIGGACLISRILARRKAKGA